MLDDFTINNPDQLREAAFEVIQRREDEQIEQRLKTLLSERAEQIVEELLTTV